MKVKNQRISTEKKISPLYSQAKTIFIALFSFGLGIALALSDIPGYIKANFALLQNQETLLSFFEKNDLQSLNIDISYKSSNKIAVKRENALKIDRLIATDEDFVPARIHHNDRSFDVKMRLKGDLPDHWDSEKSSYRVKMKDKKNIMGMTRFSLQQPGTRGDTSQWLFLKNLQMEKLLAVDYEFVNLSVNGKKMGIYAMENHFTKEFLESQNKREGIIISFDEHRFWSKFPPNQSNVSWASVYQAADLSVRNNKEVQSSITLEQQKEIAVNLLRGLKEKKLEGHQVFDSGLMGKFLAICRIWNAEHALLTHNINFYLNPLTCLLEPIGFDGMPGVQTDSPICYFSGGRIPDNWINQVLRSPVVAESYIRHLSAFSKNSYLNKLVTTFKDQEIHLRRLLLYNLIFESDADIWSSNYSLLTFDVWNMLAKRLSTIRNELNEPKPVYAYARPLGEHSSVVEIIVRNAMTQPIEVIGFENGNDFVVAKACIDTPRKPIVSASDENIIIPIQKFGQTSLRGDHKFILHKSMILNKKDNSIYLQVRLLGLKNTLSLEIPLDSFHINLNELPLFTKINEPQEKYKFIRKEEKTFIIEAGNHHIMEDLIFPANSRVIVSSGTILSFEENSSFISRSPVIAIGSLNKPIIFTSKNKTWPGIFITGSGSESVFEHVQISNTTGVGTGINPEGVNRSGWTLTGGATFHKSPVKLKNCIIENSHAEDALNIFSTSFTIRNSIFKNTNSDAFDGDFSDGNVSHCVFIEIGGDALDFSGSKVVISKTTVSEVHDKGLSVGEASEIIITNCSFDRIGFGVASKDNSFVTSDNLTINEAKIAAFAAYQKKEIFGPSKIKTVNHSISNTKTHFLSQQGSTILSNGIRIAEKTFNSNTLYTE